MGPRSTVGVGVSRFGSFGSELFGCAGAVCALRARDQAPHISLFPHASTTRRVPRALLAALPRFTPSHPEISHTVRARLQATARAQRWRRHAVDERGDHRGCDECCGCRVCGDRGCSFCGDCGGRSKACPSPVIVWEQSRRAHAKGLQ